MTDPYKILGISRDATDDEVKKAYRDLARKYHPDSYVNNPLSDLVEEKMKEINEAYDEIQKQRAKGGQNRSYNTEGNTYNSDKSFSGDFIRIRELINGGRYSEAEILIDSVSQNDRNAEWNFLKGCVLVQRGWYFDAQKFFETACYMEPNNSEYLTALNNIRNTASKYGKGYRTSKNVGRGGGCSGCDICTGLICTDCLCECCGGDLISCC